MAGSLRGTPQFKARLRAVKTAFKPMGRDWADDTARESNRSAPRGATGRLSRSHKRKSATLNKATVVAIFYGLFVNRGAKPHTIEARNAPSLVFQASGRTIFAKKVHHTGVRGTRYVDRAASHALHRNVNAAALIDAWNDAA